MNIIRGEPSIDPCETSPIRVSDELLYYLSKLSIL